MHRKSMFTLTTIACLGLAMTVLAQQPGQQGGRGRGQGGPPGGGGFFFGGGGFTSRMALLNADEVKKELELAHEQVQEVQKVAAEIREKYGLGGRGGPGGERGRGGQQGGEGRRRGPGDGNNDRSSLAAPTEWYFVQAQQPQGQGRRGGGFGEITPEQRAEMERQRVERTREENAKLAEILLP